jgi:hypothetical protein
MKHIVTVVRWSARLLTVGLAALFVFFLIGEGLPSLSSASLRVVVLSLFLLLSLAGLLIALRHEAFGGWLALAGSAGFYLTDCAASGFHRFPGGGVFPLLLITPLLYLFVSWRRGAAPKL